MKKVTIVIICIMLVAVIALGAVVFMLVNDKDNKVKENENNTNSSQEKENEQKETEVTKIGNMKDAIENLSDDDAVEYFWEALKGYWTATDSTFKLFVGFENENGVRSVAYGYFETEWHEVGKVTDIEATGENEVSITIFVPAAAATEMSDARPEYTAVIVLDVGNFEQDGKIKVKIEDQGTSNWYEYSFGGVTLNEAYNNL